ncbi:NACHT domain-containing protein [Lysinibacillus sp. BW-2-10]|uniref:NACHT domain-containing protein n=1 Tax=Lysinibacillus sp. BW-2-10 TaxID=2590030 RepID=UPI00117F1AE9|nr:NACHT domain-containing protein [Lysinibacillus sp. BW-2-10]TSI10552.1 NACHT domain-containing protein [Lysinibacillus sp. BW-2-10]
MEKFKGLIKVQGNGNDMAIIFVHGLKGHPYKTWTKKDNLSFPELISEDEDFQKFDVFTFAYDTHFILKRHHFKVIADILFTEIEAKMKGYKAIMFITHSMGGIVVQSLLTQQVELRNQSFIDKIYATVYLAVPFFGSKIASMAASIPFLFLPPLLGERFVSIQVQSLKTFSKDLSELSIRWGTFKKQNLLSLEELNIYGHSDKTVAVEFANVAHIYNSKGVDETHISICKVDKNSTVYNLIKQFFLEVSLKVKKISSDSKIEVIRYNSWLQNKTELFYVPGAKVPLSIEDAWASLYILDELKSDGTDTLENELLKYHEWARLSMQDNKRKSGQEIIETQKMVVVIGGPGSGKSTLAQRTANRLVKRGEKVLYFKFSYLVKIMEQGKTFEEALWLVVLDGFSGNKDDLISAYKEIDVLIADGLDESGKSMNKVIQSLHDWLIGRDKVRVIITTRPIGYNSAKFSHFYHVEILPLDKNEISNYSMKLLEALNGREESVKLLHKQFLDKLDRNKMVNIAARSPLLLNFLIQLLVSGNGFGNYRAEMYGRILNKWVNDSERAAENKLERELALRSIEFIGWLLQNVLEGKNGNSEEELINELSEFIKKELDYPILKSRQLASECLKYWVDIGVLEKLELGFESGYTFIHLTLGEFAAAKYINNLSLDEKKEILLAKIHKPIWRETLLLCSGLGSTHTFVESILELVKGKADLYNDTSLAAAMLMEQSSLPDLNKKVSSKALELLQSSIPTLSIESGRSLEEIARQDPEWMIKLVEPLFEHEYLWTKLMAYKLAIATNNIKITEELIKTLLDLKPEASLRLPSLVPSALWVEWNKIFEELIFRILDDPLFTDSQLESIFLMSKEVGFNARVHMSLSTKLSEMNKGNLLEIFNGDFRTMWDRYNFQDSIKRIAQSERGMLEIILRCLSIDVIKEKDTPPSLMELSKFIQAINIWDKQINEVSILVSQDIDIVVEVFKGIILTYGLDEELIHRDVSFLMESIGDNGRLFNSLPDCIKPELIDININKQINLNKIIRGLYHPSETIQENSTLLLANSEITPELVEKLKSEFMIAEGDCLRYFSIILVHWLEEDSIDILIEKLNVNNQNGLKYILEYLPKTDNILKLNIIKELLMKMVHSTDSGVVQYVARAIKRFEFEDVEEEIIDVIFYWDKTGVICDKHPIRVKGSCCPECNIVPHNPIEDLLEILSISSLLTFEQRMYFANHKNSYVQKVGSKNLTNFMDKNREYIIESIQKVKSDINCEFLFEALFNLDNTVLAIYLEDLITIYESNSAKIRLKLLAELSTRKLGEIKLIQDLILKALNDSESSVKNQALESYRMLGMEVTNTSL